MKHFAIYSPLTGRILRSGSCVSDDLLSQVVNEDEDILEVPAVVSDTLHYVNVDTITNRPSIVSQEMYHLALDEELTIEVPPNTEVKLDNDTFIVEDGTLEFSSSKYGVFELFLNPPFPWQTTVCRVIVVP